MDINPLMAREMRARWRNPRAFGLILVYVAILTVAMVGSYGYSTAHLGESPSSQRLQVLGHHMFQTLTWMQTLAWLLIAPALTATSIAAERERGLLEGMTLSHLTPRHIVTGKLQAALSFMLVVLVVPLPIVATCFIMGGVSPGEFVLATLLEIVTAVNCAVMGLLCSAWSRRAGEALRAAFALVLLWAVTSGVTFPISTMLWSATSGSTTLDMIRLQLATLFADTNPVVAVLAITDPTFTVRSGGVYWAHTLPPWAISIGVQALGTLALLCVATRGVAKAPDSEPEPHRAPATPARRGQSRPRAEVARSRRAGGFWELPLAGSLRFGNPVLQRELHSRLRSRRPDRVMLWLEVGVGVFLLYWFLRALWWALLAPDMRGGLWYSISNGLLLITMFTSALMGAATFTRERESGTWEGIRLSLLSPATIITGKLATPLLTCMLVSVPLWPILLLCVRSLDWPDTATSSSIWFQPGVTLVQTVGALLVCAAAAWCYTAWGMLLSWRCRNTSAATGWVIGTLFVPLVIIPALAGTLGAGNFTTNQRLQTFLGAFHPFYAINGLTYGPYWLLDMGTGPVAAALCVIVHVVVGSVMLLVLYRSMQRGVRRRERPTRQRNARLAYNV